MESTTTTTTVQELDAANFLYFCEHLYVYFESFDKGWITYATQPHPHTGRIFKIITNDLDVQFTKDSSIPISGFYLDDGEPATWGEIYGRDGNLTATTSPHMSQVLG